MQELSLNGRLIIGFFSVIASGLSLLGVVYSVKSRKAMKREEDEKKAREKEKEDEREFLKERFATVWVRIDELRAADTMQQKQLDTLQGEHNVMSCGGKKKK